MNEFQQLEREYGLPPARIRGSRNQTEFYGALELLAQYCGLSRPILREQIDWKHGWHPQWVQLSPDLITLKDDAPSVRGVQFLVARRDEQEYLQSQGVHNVRPIGLPVVYVPPRPIERQPNTLLVLPVHSLYYTKIQSNFDAYADYIASIAHRFQEVLVCIHPVCIENGYWVNSFRQRGIRCVTGAFVSDFNSLYRLQILMSRFEFVTSNGFGSHLAYAAYFGAKVSLAGPIAEPRVSDYVNDWFFANRPSELRTLMALYSEASLREKLPQFFVEPHRANDAREWGSHQVGADCRPSPSEIREIFGWYFSHRLLVDYPKQAIGSLRQVMRTIAKVPYRLWKDRDPLAREQRRLDQLPDDATFESHLPGIAFQSDDPRQFLSKYRRGMIDGEWIYPNESKQPRALMIGVGTGLSALALLKQYPQTRLTLLEPHPAKAQLLSANLQRAQPKHPATVRQQAVAERSGMATYIPGTSLRIAALSDNTGHPDAQTVTCVTLSSCLQEPVDFLWLVAPFREYEILHEAREQLQQVQQAYIRLYIKLGEFDRLSSCYQLLRDAGFTLHVRAGRDAKSPFKYRMTEIVWLESIAELYCYRPLTDHPS